MLRLNSLVGFGAGHPKGTKSISYIGRTDSTANSASYTFNSFSIGAADFWRYCVFGYGSCQSGVPAIEPSDLTVNGVSATFIVKNRRASGSNQNSLAALYGMWLPVGTTADVVVTTTETGTFCSLACWAMYNLSSFDVVDTAAPGQADPITLDVDVPANGFAIGYTTTYGGTSFAWNGLTEQFDATPDTGFHTTGAHGSFGSAQSPASIDCNPAGYSSIAGVCASWS